MGFFKSEFPDSRFKAHEFSRFSSEKCFIYLFIFHNLQRLPITRIHVLCRCQSFKTNGLKGAVTSASVKQSNKSETKRKKSMVKVKIVGQG